MSTDKISAVIALDPSVDREAVQAVLPQTGNVDLIGVVDIYEGSWTQLEDTAADVVLLACADDTPTVLPFIENAVKERPTRPVVVLVTGSPNGFVRRAFEAGAEDIIALAAGATPTSVAFSLEKAVARRHGGGGAASASLGSFVCVLGPKGGAGKTLTACNVGVALAAAGERVTVVDLALQFGDVALALGLSPSRTLYDLATSGGALDTGKLEAYLTPHPSGARALLAPVRPEQAAHVTLDFLREVFPLLRRINDVVIVDTPPSFTPEVMTAIDASTDVCLVGMLDSLSLKSTKLGYEALERMGYDAGRVHLVLNRADSRVGITPEDVEAVVRRRPDALVPSHRDVAQSINDGSPIAISHPRSEAAKAFQGLAATWAKADVKPLKPTEKSGRRRGLLRRSA